MAKIIIPTPLRKFTNNESTFQAEGNTIKEAIAQLIHGHPSLGQHLLNDLGQVRSFIKIYLEDEDINSLKKEATPITDTSTISIVPAIAGG